MNCQHCQTELPKNHGGTSCPSCGHDLVAQSESNPPNATTQDKSVYWVVFWITFFGAPILCLLAGSARAGSGVLFLPILGAIVAGFSLAKIFTKTPEAFVVIGVLFALGVLAIYAGIIFIGCLVALGRGGGI